MLALAGRMVAASCLSLPPTATLPSFLSILISATLCPLLLASLPPALAKAGAPAASYSFDALYLIAHSVLHRLWLVFWMSEGFKSFP